MASPMAMLTAIPIAYGRGASLRSPASTMTARPAVPPTTRPVRFGRLARPSVANV